MKTLFVKLLSTFGPEFLTFLLEFIINKLSEDEKSTVGEQSVGEVAAIVERNTVDIATKVAVDAFRSKFG